MGYYDGYNADLLRFIPPDAKTVLEIGCGEGALCAAYRRVNPSVLWFGVDSNREALDNTPEEMQVWCADLNETFGARDFMSESLEREIDCVICGDVLEHLINPMETLRACTEHVKSGAQVLACIPNVQHWTVIRDLLDGKWDYTDSGLLDRTHLRFFTLKSIREMFDAAGLQVFEIVGRDLFNEGFEDWYADRVGDHPQKEMRAYQYIVRAIKPSMVEAFKLDDRGYPDGPHIVPCPIPKLHIHAVTAEACCARPRILEPFAMLGTIPGVKCTAGLDNATPHPPGQIMIQQRFRYLDLGCQKLHLDTGWLIVAEIDDEPGALWSPFHAGTLFSSPIVYEKEPVDIFCWLRAVHAIQCSTEALAEVCRRYNPNVVVFENQIAELGPPPNRGNPKTLGLFFGAQNRENDWAPIMPALNRVLADHPEVCVEVVHDKLFFDAIEGRKNFYEFCEYNRYRKILASCDIALLPLEDTPFNRCKSNIKFLECAAEGVAVLASSTIYEEPILQHNAGSCYGRAEEFEVFLRALIRNASLRLTLAVQAYNYVRDNRLLSQHYRKCYEWYQSLLSSKPELDRQLCDRVPELSARLAPA